MNGLKQLRESCLSKANNNVKVANEMVVKIFKEGISNKKIDPKNVSIKALFEGLVDTDNLDLGNAVKVAEAIGSSAFADVLTIITSALTIEPYEIFSDDLAQLCTEGNAKFTYAETVKGMTAIGGVRRRLETQAYGETDFEDKYIGVEKCDFGRIVSLTMEDIFNDATNDIQDAANRIGEDAGQHKHQMIAETIECLPRTAFGEVTSRAFVYKGTAYTQAQFYSTDHSAILDFQTNCNVATGGITQAGLTNAYNNFASLTDEKGKRIVVRPQQILVNSLNELTLATLLATDLAVGQNFSSTTGGINDVNQFGPRGKVKLASVTSPFLATTSGLAYMGNFKKALLWLWVQKPQTVTQGGDSNLAFERQIVWRARFNYYGGVALRDYRYITRITTS